METYKNLGGNSGISAYSVTDDSIKVLFKDGGLYLYNTSRPGRAYVDRMKVLAQSGRGLNSLISSVIRKNYAAKLS